MHAIHTAKKPDPFPPQKYLPPVFLFAGCLLLALLVLGPAYALGAGPAPALPGNSGGSGLFDMPSARIMEDWNLRLHYSRVGNYNTYAVSASFLPRLEVNARITDFTGVAGLSTDKSFDVKILLTRESEAWPAIVLGATDIHGTAVFTSRYLVASKLFGPLDVSFGIGQGILAGEITHGRGSAGSASEDAAIDFLTSSTTKSRLFGGAELRITDGLSLVGEYSSLDYEKLFHIDKPAANPINWGLKYRLGKNIFSLSYQRGRELSCAYSAQFPLKPEGMLPWKVIPFWRPSAALQQKAYNAAPEELALILQQEVAAEGFSNVRTSVADAAVWVEIENPTYLSNAKAMGRALRAICALVPPRIEWIYLSIKFRDIVLMTVKLCRQDFEAYVDGRLDSDTLLEFTSFATKGNEQRQAFLRQEPGATPLTTPFGAKKFEFKILPRLNSYLNDISAGVYRFNFAVLWTAAYYPWAGGAFSTIFSTPLYNNIPADISTSETHPVRSDTVDYIRDTSPRIETLTYDQLINLPGDWLGRAAAGMFESAYGGLGLEVFRYFSDGRWGLGLESEWVKKRDLDHEFMFKDDSPLFKPAFVNIYHKLVPSLGLDVGLKLGRFLHGDWGGRLDISRTYRHFTMGAWYTVTDTHDFDASFNKGYNDKGVYLVVPFSVFKDHDNPIKLLYSFSPWTRDVGQTVRQPHGLYPMANPYASSAPGDVDSFRRQMEGLKD
jgi:hypothetical protein